MGQSSAAPATPLAKPGQVFGLTEADATNLAQASGVWQVHAESRVLGWVGAVVVVVARAGFQPLPVGIVPLAVHAASLAAEAVVVAAGVDTVHHVIVIVVEQPLLGDAGEQLRPQSRLHHVD